MDMAEKSAFIFQTLGMDLQRDFAAALAARSRIIRRLDFPDAPAYNGKHRSGGTNILAGKSCDFLEKWGYYG